MLTDSERAWLNNRDNHAEHFCRWCDTWETCLGEFGAIFCPSWTQKVQLLEAAEFEARVAAKLAGITESMMQTIQEYDDTYPCWACPANENCAGLECREVLLCYARLTVEEEMDADR